MPEPPTLPVIFSKPAAALSGPTDPIVRPTETSQLDYVSARDLMEGESSKLNSPILLQIMRAKGRDTFLPTGPWLVTADEVGRYEDIRIQTWVNDELRQDAYAKEMTNSPLEIIEWLSSTTTLRPGDIITTGTPGGVAMGMANPRWLTPGDTVRITMTGLGTMSTPVRQEPARP